MADAALRLVPRSAGGAARLPLVAKADGYGRFSLEDNGEHPDGFVASGWAPGMATAVGTIDGPATHEPIEFGDVVLEPAHRLAGSVVDVHGRPQPGFELQLERAGPPVSPSPIRSRARITARTDAGGEFSIRDAVAEGEWWPAAGLRNATTAQGEPLVVSPRQPWRVERDTEVHVVLAARRALRGRVTAASGAPIPRAALAVANAHRGRVRTEADGSFVLFETAPGTDEPFALVAEAPDHQTLVTAPIYHWGTTAADVVLLPAHGRGIEVRWAEDGSLAKALEVRVTAVPGERRPRLSVTGGAGQWSVAGLEDAAYHVLVLAAGDDADAPRGAFGPIPLTPPHATAHPMVIELPAAIDQSVFVQSAGGDGIPGATVVLVRQLTPGASAVPLRDQVANYRSPDSDAVVAATATTGPDGRCTLRAWPGEHHVLVATHAHHQPASVPWTLRRDEGILVMSSGALLEAQLVPAGAGAALWAMAGAPEHTPPLLVCTPHADPVAANVRTVRFDPEGAARVEGLAPGTWTLALDARVKNSAQAIAFPQQTVRLQASEARRIEFDVARLLPGSLAARVTLNGHAGARTVMLVPLDGGQPIEARALHRSTNESGELDVPWIPQGEWSLRVLAGGAAPVWVTAPEVVSIHAGKETTLEWNARTVQVHVQALDAQGQPHAGATLAHAVGGRMVAAQHPVTDAQGRAVLTLPVGDVDVLVVPSGVSIHLATRIWSRDRRTTAPSATDSPRGTPPYLEVGAWRVTPGDDGTHRVLRTM